MTITIEKEKPWQSATPSIESVIEQIKLFIPPLFDTDSASPSFFIRTIEEQVAQFCSSLSDQLFACVLAQIFSQKDAAAVVNHSREQAKQRGCPLRSPETRSKTLRLLGGTKVTIQSLYCSPNPSAASDSQPFSGVFPELAQMGFGSFGSQAFESRIARLCTLCPSFEIARTELAHQGVDLNYKTLRSISLNMGEEMLGLRNEWIDQFLEGTLEEGTELKDKHVVACIDGGRIRLRTSGEGPPREGSLYPPFTLNWREPKLLIIYVVDDKGRRKVKEKFHIDGTFQGPDHAMELLAMHLQRLGVKQAASLTFLGDGASWIWNRSSWLFDHLEIPEEKRHEALDFYHGAHHISLALGYVGLSKEEQTKKFGELRHTMRNGKWEEVVKELKKLGIDVDEKSIFWREIRYLEKHGNAGRLQYLSLKEKGLPRGSGAIESAIRRVVNQKLKGNGIFWKEGSAEAMLQLRGVLLSGNWEEMLDKVRKEKEVPQRKGWKWEAEKRSSKVEADDADDDEIVE